MKKNLPKIPRATGSDPGPLKPSTWNELCDLVESLQKQLTELRPKSSASVKYRIGKNGFTAWTPRRKKGTSATAGPFCKVYPDGTSWKLLGGTITGGEGVVTIAAVTIGTIGEEPADGTFYWLACDVSANEEDGVLLPGCELTAATPGNGTSMPVNTVPTVVALSGQIHISLGEWMGGKFTPSACGNIQVNHCPGTLSHARA